jgi:hypothetical protein
MTEDSMVTLNDKVFFITADPASNSFLVLHNDNCIVECDSEDEAAECIVTYYEDTYMSLVEYIETVNEGVKLWMADDPDNRWAGLLTTDEQHWADYGITTVIGMKHYLEQMEL